MKYYLLWNHFKHVPTLITEKRGLCMSFPIWYADIEHGETFTARATHQKQIQERHWSKARLLLIKSTGINKILQESYQQEKTRVFRCVYHDRYLVHHCIASQSLCYKYDLSNHPRIGRTSCWRSLVHTRRCQNSHQHSPLNSDNI